MADNTVRIRATVDDKVSGPLARMKDRFDNLGKSKGFASIVTGVGLGAGLSSWNALSSGISTATDFITDSIQAASDLNETMSKSNVVFGSSAREIDAWGNTTAKTLGLSKQAALEAAATFGNLFNQIGVSKPEVASMSQRLVQLAGDLASFNNIDPTDALEKLRSGLAGEAEPLRTVGVFLSQQKVDAEAARLGFKQVAGQYSENAKILARYNIILRETTSSQGDFARTSDQMANQQRILTAELANTEAELGDKLLPVVRSAQRDFITLFDILDNEAPAITAEGLGSIFTAIGAVATAPFRFFEKSMEDAGRSIGEFIDGTKEISTGVGKMADDMVAGSGKAADDVIPDFMKIAKASDYLSKHWGEMTDAAKDYSKEIRDEWHNAAQDMIDDFFDPIEERSDLLADHLANVEARQAATNAKTKADFRSASEDITQSLDDQATKLNDLGKRGILTGKEVDRFEADAKASYKALGKTVPPELQKIIDKLRTIASFNGKNFKFKVTGTVRIDDNTGGNTGTRRSTTRHAAGAVGFTSGIMGSPDGGVMGEAGTEAYAILRNPKPLKAGGGLGGVTFNTTINVGAGSGLSAGGARQFVAEFGPAIYADMQRKGYLKRTGNGLTG